MKPTPFSGEAKYAHLIIKGVVERNLPLENRHVFAEAILRVAGCRRA